MSNPIFRRDLKPPPVGDDDFEDAVDRDLWNEADLSDIDILESQPGIWKRSLKARLTYLHGAIAKAGSGWSETVVAQPGHPTRSFATRVSGLRRGRLLDLHQVAAARAQRAAVLAQEQESARQQAAREARKERTRVTAEAAAAAEQRRIAAQEVKKAERDEQMRVAAETKAARAATKREPPQEPQGTRAKSIRNQRVAVLETLVKQAFDEGVGGNWRALVVTYVGEFRRGVPLGHVGDWPERENE